MTYWARWLIELGDLSSSVTYRARFFKRRKKEKKWKLKAIMTTWSTKSKTPYRSQFVTDKKTLCGWSINVVLVFKKILTKKTFFFTLSSLIYLTRDYLPSTARELNDLVLKRRPLTSLVFHTRIVFIWENFKSLVFPAWIFWLQRYAISDSMHQRKYTFFCLLFICNEFSLILCEQTNCTLHESRGLSRVDVAEKNYLEWL